MKLITAELLVPKILRLLEPACADLLVVGSVRRGSALPTAYKHEKEVKDIEIAVVPRAPVAVFGEPLSAKNRLEAHLATLLHHGELRLCEPSRRVDGPRQKRFLLPEGVELELWIASVSGDNFGVQVAIRTGNMDFAKALVTQRKHKGLLPNGWMLEGGYLWPFRLEDKDERAKLTHRNAPMPPLACRHEADFFRHLGLGEPPEPVKRNVDTATKLRREVVG